MSFFFVWQNKNWNYRSVDNSGIQIFLDEDGSDVDDEETFMSYDPKTTFIVAVYQLLIN
jgi:hypothetical protein